MKIENLESKIPTCNFIFGILIVVGGFIGYFKAHSIASLSAGLFFGNLLMFSIWGIKEKIWGYYLADIVSISLLIFFILRLMQTGKPMPAIPVIVLASVSIILNTLILHHKRMKSI